MAALYPDLAGKVVLITGGATGIGAAIVRRFAKQNARVAFLDIADDAGQALAAETGARYVRADLTDIPALRQAIETVAQEMGPVQVLVNNAAHDERHKTPDVTVEYWDGRLAVNLRHQFFAAQAVLPGMQAAKAGSIINFGSISWMIGEGGMPGYSASKAAVLGLTRSLARDFGPDNIRVNSIAPGWIMTERQKTLWLTPAGEEELMRRQCLKRQLVPDEVASLTLFLASDDASACTNQQYIVDGGWV